MTAIEAIQKLIRREIKPVTVTCTVDKVDKKSNTCTCTPLTKGSGTVEAVRLSSLEGAGASVVMYPKVNSLVIIQFIERSRESAFIAQYGEIEEIKIAFGSVEWNLNGQAIELNGGRNGGLAIVNKLVERINRLEQRMNTHQHIYMLSGTPTLTTQDALGTNKPIVPTTVADIENTKVKH